MIYAQVKSGEKLHLVHEPGEVDQHGRMVAAGRLGYPICGRPVAEGFRMTINVPLGHACKNCRRVAASR